MADWLEVDLAPGLDGLKRLEPVWRDLWDADPHATAFQSPDWLIPWAVAFQPKECLAALLLRDGAPVALLPLFSHDQNGPPRLMPLGAGTTDWLGAVCRPDAQAADLATLIAETADYRGVGVVELPQLVPGSPIARATAPPGWRAEDVEGEACPALDLPADLSKSLRQNLRTARNRLERDGAVEIVRASGAKVLASLEHLIALHDARWAGEGGGVLDDADVCRFHRAAAPRMEAAGLLRLYELRLDGRAVASLYGLQAKRRFHYYIGGFAPDLAHGSPGNLLIEHALQAAETDGCTLFDFLRGQEGYKYRWGATDRPSLSRRFISP